MLRQQRALSPLLLLAMTAFPITVAAERDVFVHTDPVEMPIDVGFAGGDVTVFGVVPQGADGVIAICRSGETPPVTLARKERVGILWMATKRFHIENLPGLYLMATTAPLKELLGDQRHAICQQHSIGYAALRENWEVERVSGEEAADDLDELFKGLVRLKETEGLYRAAEGVIRYENKELFYYRFRIPDGATVGSQAVTAYAIKDGRIVASGSVEFRLHRAGMVDWLFNLAWQHAVLYGVLAVLAAAGAGLTASRIFGGRGGH